MALKSNCSIGCWFLKNSWCSCLLWTTAAAAALSFARASRQRRYFFSQKGDIVGWNFTARMENEISDRPEAEVGRAYTLRPRNNSSITNSLTRQRGQCIDWLPSGHHELQRQHQEQKLNSWQKFQLPGCRGSSRVWRHSHSAGINCLAQSIQSSGVSCIWCVPNTCPERVRLSYSGTRSLFYQHTVSLLQACSR